MSVNSARKHLADELGIKLRKPRIVWEHFPEGFQRYRYVAARRVRGKRIESHTEPRRGKERCQHTTYITNRNGKILKDPDTGYNASYGCKQIARWQRNNMTSGIFNMITRFCDAHARERGAK